MVDLYELTVGDYVVFRCGGFAKVAKLEGSDIDEVDIDCEYSHTIKFEGIPNEDDYMFNGRYYEDEDPHLLDIVDIVPASVIERKLNEQKEAEDEIPF